MDEHQLYGVTHGQALNFFYVNLLDIVDGNSDIRVKIKEAEIMYTASVLAHFSQTSTQEGVSMAVLQDLIRVFDVFVLDRSKSHDPAIMEEAGSQILFLAGFFREQMKQRHNLEFYDKLGAGYYHLAGERYEDANRRAVLLLMSEHFPFWTLCCSVLNKNLTENQKLFWPHN